MGRWLSDVTKRVFSLIFSPLFLCSICCSAKFIFILKLVSLVVVIYLPAGIEAVWFFASVHQRAKK
jgi:hypothetical protein